MRFARLFPICLSLLLCASPCAAQTVDSTEDENNNSTRGIAELIIAKHRNGALKTVYARFIDKFAKFADVENDLFESGCHSCVISCI